MLISENWLREWIDPELNTEQLADLLTMAGLEVGSVESTKAKFSNVVVGQIINISAHPDSNKLSLCRVLESDDSTLDIVCGASNIFEGMKVALATVGAQLPSGLEIKPTTIRGFESNGMICSAAELGLADKSEGVMQLQESAPLGTALEDYLNLDDQVLELELTPNRGDCLGLAGVVREVAALTCSNYQLSEIESIAASTDKTLPITIEDYDGCPRYLGRVIENINPQAVTPDWMKEKLRRCGVRPISSVVDITNYVMLELGQPMHAFDLDNINSGITVRYAKAGEKLTLLDERELALKSDDLLICDHQGPVALAGIMGGLGSGISDTTQSVFLECAYFSREQIIGKARRIGMQTDASYRYERGVDPYLQARAMERATHLLLEICGGQAGSVTEAVNLDYVPKKSAIELRLQRVSRVLGVAVTQDQASDYLSRLGCQLQVSGDSFMVTAPSFRFDLEKEHDLIEEIARLYGYNNIPENPPSAAVSSQAHSESFIVSSRFRNLLIDLEYQEAISYSFVDPRIQEHFNQCGSVPAQAIALKNPIADNLAQMRLSLVPGLLQAAANNYLRQQRRIRLFEMGNIYYLHNNQRVEEYYLGGILTGDRLSEQWSGGGAVIDFFDAKADVEAIVAMAKKSSQIVFQPAQIAGFHPGRTAEVLLDQRRIGLIGQIMPTLAEQLGIEQEIYFFQLNLAQLAPGVIPSFQPISKFPSTRRDLSVLVDKSISAQQLLDAIKASAGEYLVDLKLFDVYTGKPIDSTKKSVSFGLTFQALNRTLTESEMDEASQQVLQTLTAEFDAQLRE